jgi:hypothetical protein
MWVSSSKIISAGLWLGIFYTWFIWILILISTVQPNRSLLVKPLLISGLILSIIFSFS